MVSEFDICCAARAMVRRYGETAGEEARLQAAAYRREGDGDGQAVWERVAAAVDALHRERTAAKAA